jgi:molecular chaperone DnaJ
VKVKLNLQEISSGVTKKFKLKKYVQCTHCNGSGAEGNATETCPECKGTGRVIRTQQSIFGMMRTEAACPNCGGEGKVIKNKCNHCHGDGIVMGEEVVEVNIPAGVMGGMQLSMRGKGNAGKRNGVNGDLLILVEEEAHPQLIRDENDLIYNLLLDIPTATLGGYAEVPTIDGKARITINPGTQPGTVLRLREKGLPSINGGRNGDIVVNISVYIPESLSKDESKAIESFRGSENFQPSESIREKIFRRFKNFF